ncbi:MAG TPA: hypothetical protein DEH11_20880 [Actinobacteria bacterium]|nr:hypothetical protein [Actinomycetota bacterium]
MVKMSLRRPASPAGCHDGRRISPSPPEAPHDGRARPGKRLMTEYSNVKDRGRLVGLVFSTQALGLIAGVAAGDSGRGG